MLKKLSVIAFLLLSIFVVDGTGDQLPKVHASRVFCSTYENKDYYIETDELSGTRSGLTYIGVYGSDGSHYSWCFSHTSQRGWEYEYWPYGEQYSKRKVKGKVSDSQLANDVLYITLQEKENMS